MVEESLEGRIRVSDGAVLATVAAVGNAQWDSADGKAPEKQHEIDPDEVIRLARFSVDQVWKGQFEGDFVAALAGGKIGCWTFVSDRMPELAPGEQFAVFLLGHPDRAGLESVHSALTLWPVDEQGRIVTPEDGSLSPTEIAERATSNTPE